MKAAVVIPLYKPRGADLQWFEIISLKRGIEVFGGRQQIIFIAPDGMKFDYLPADVNYSVETFDPKYFKSLVAYNRLMLNPKFYARFRALDYILIYQLDAFVFSDRLEEFCALGHDYIGSPWPLGVGKKNGHYFSVGNGGFSLRRVKSCFEMLSKHGKQFDPTKLGEDFVLAHFGKLYPTKFHVAPALTASRFSVEFLAERYCRKNFNVLPFGCHCWQKYSSKFYIRTLSEFGYNLEPFAHLMSDIDLQARNLTLSSLVWWRLRLRLKDGLPLLKYLPSDEEFYVFAADEQSGELVQRLYDEGLKIINIDNIPFLDSDEQIQAVAEVLRLTDVRGLLISLKNDAPFIKKMTDPGGAKYEREFISFWHEFQKQSTTLLRKMSRPSVKRFEIISSS